MLFRTLCIGVLVSSRLERLELAESRRVGGKEGSHVLSVCNAIGLRGNTSQYARFLCELLCSGK